MVGHIILHKEAHFWVVQIINFFKFNIWRNSHLSKILTTGPNAAFWEQRQNNSIPFSHYSLSKFKDSFPAPLETSLLSSFLTSHKSISVQHSFFISEMSSMNQMNLGSFYL